MTIFAMSIRYLKEHFWEAANKQNAGLLESDVRYVITIPAIWDDNAKQFMREAAIEVIFKHFVFTITLNKMLNVTYKVDFSLKITDKYQFKIFLQRTSGSRGWGAHPAPPPLTAADL